MYLKCSDNFKKSRERSQKNHKMRLASGFFLPLFAIALKANSFKTHQPKCNALCKLYMIQQTFKLCLSVLS